MLSALVVLALPLSLAQEPAPAPAPVPQDAALRIFLDCPPFECDLDFLRTEIRFVSYMQNRQDAAVYILVSTQRTGAGGQAYTLTFLGQGALQGRADTLTFATQPAEADDAVRRRMARVLRRGLVRYLGDSPLAEHIDVRYEAPAGAAAAARQQRDPWNYWVFVLGVSGFFNGETQTSSRSVSGSASASRVTEAWKAELEVSAYNSRNRFDLDSVTTFISESHNYSFDGLLVRSLGPRWSAGGRANIESSTFSNQDLRLRLAPAVEFNIFPYAQSTRRQLTFNYSVGVQHVQYADTTIFGKIEESLVNHRLQVALDFRQPWGSAGISLSGSQYLHDASKVNAGIFGSVNLNVMRGLRFRVGGSYNIVRDQLSLPAGGATPQEILVRQRQLATSYNYFFSVGLNYTFGSIYNNVVNPRFGGGNRTFFF